MSEYKPTYEQLEKALRLARGVVDVATRHMKNETYMKAAATDLAAIDAALAPPPPAYEEVTVERWAVVAPSGYVETTYATEGQAQGEVEDTTSCFFGYSVVKLTGTRRVAVPQKVVRRVSVEAMIGGAGCPKEWLSRGDAASFDEDCPFRDHEETHGKTGTLTFEWEE